MREGHQADGSYVSRRLQTVGNRWLSKVLVRKVKLKSEQELQGQVWTLNKHFWDTSIRRGTRPTSCNSLVPLANKLKILVPV